MLSHSIKNILILSLIFLGSHLSAAPNSNTEKSTQWIDVRSSIEHKIDSIEGDLRITHYEIVSEVQKRFPDKNADITLYCRSGGRAGIAKSALEKAGYTQIKNAGGISDARKQRGILQ